MLQWAAALVTNTPNILQDVYIRTVQCETDYNYIITFSRSYRNDIAGCL